MSKKTKLLVLVMLLTLSTTAFGVLLMEENFNYTAGTALTATGNWTAHSGAGANAILVTTPGLTYSGYVASGIGEAAKIDTAGEDVNRTFTSQTSGTVYVSFMVKVDTAKIAGDYFLHFSSNPLSTSYFNGRVFAKKDGSDNIAFGLGRNREDTTFTDYSYALNTTYLFILKYEIVDGAANDIASLFILTSGIPTSEPGTPTIGPLQPTTGTDVSNIGSIALRQGTAANAPRVIVDGIRIGQTWNDLFPTSNNLPPAILNVTRTPQFPGAGVPVVISATITDDYCPLANIADSLFYAVNDSSTWTAVTHDSVNVATSTFYYSIAGQPVYTKIHYYIWAKDDSGASSRISTITYEIPGNQPPIISALSRIPFTPEPDQAFVIRTKVTDDFTPTAALLCSLKYAANPGAGDTTWTVVGKDSLKTDTFFFTIPGQSLGTTIHYHVWAQDDSGASSRTATYNYLITAEPIIRILNRPRYIEGGATSGTPGTGTPFAVYAGVKPGAPNDTFYYKGRIGTRGLTWNDTADVWAADGATWTTLSTVACGEVTDTVKLWIVMKAIPSATVDTFVTVRMRRLGTTTNRDSDTLPIKVMDMTSTGDGGWLYGHIYESDGGPARENAVVLAYQGGVVVGAYITENNNIDETYTSTDAGYIRMAVKSGIIDSLQVRNRFTNEILSFYTIAPKPWLVNAGDSTDIDDYVALLDVGVIEVLAPAGNIVQGSLVVPQAKVKNFGNQPAPAFDVVFTISQMKENGYSDTVNVPGLAVGEEITVSFESYHVVGDIGNIYGTEAKTELVGDMYAPNNSLYGDGFEIIEQVAAIWTPKEEFGEIIKNGGALVGVPGSGKDGSMLYAFAGTKTGRFYKYDMTAWTYNDNDSILYGFKYKPSTAVFDTLKLNKKYPAKGAALCYDGDNTIYAVKGNGTNEFWAYDLSSDAGWTLKAYVPSPKGLKGGTSILAYNGKVYLLAGAQKKDPSIDNFYEYDPTENFWTPLAKLELGVNNKPWKDGSSISLLDGTIYALKGGDKANFFYAYNWGTQTWEAKQELPIEDTVFDKYKKKVLVKDGGATASGDGAIYAIKGGATNTFWKYTPDSEPGWEWLGLIQFANKKEAPKTGAAMAYLDNKIWLLVGNKTKHFWSYTPGTKAIARVMPSTIASTLADITTTPVGKFTATAFSKTIIYTIPASGKVSLKLYNASGRLVQTLVNEYKNAGSYSFDIRNSTSPIPNGVYFLKYNDGLNTAEAKIIIQ
ncbi:MAG: T9SS type A sorting domain-containing protein [Candidatus Latescibacteria bacterium]|nr:T9SS type A sorting domain-containing protein [Candidatus Latescibacterota bacterium]